MNRPTRVRWGRLLLVPALAAGLYFAVPRAPVWLERYREARKASDEQQVKADLRSLRAAVDRFTIDMNRYPAGWSELRSRPGDGKRWQGPYLEDSNDDPVDPWGRPYQFTTRYPSGELALVSLGADGVVGGRGPNADWSDFEAKFLR